MRVAELKALIEDMPDNCVVLVPGNDHSYRRVWGHDTTAAFNGSDYFEWYGEENADERELPERALVME